MRTILAGCAMALLAPTAVLAQGLGVGGSIGAGLGATLSPGAGAGANISAGTGLGATLDPGPGMGANLGAAPGSTVSPPSAPLARSGAIRAAATADLRAGATIRDSTGAVLGRVDHLTQATPGTPASVTVTLDNRSYTLPTTSFSVRGDLLIYSGAAVR